MSLNNLGLGFVFEAKDRASETILRLKNNFNDMDSSVNRTQKSSKSAFVGLAAGAVSAAAGVQALGAAFGAARVAGVFEQGIARVGAVSKASAEELNVLKDAAIEAGLATQFSPAQAADGLNNLAVQGFNAAESAKALGGALAFAQGGQVGIGEATTSVAAAIRAFSLETSQATEVADKFLAITTSTGLQARDMEQAISGVARGAGVTKQALDEMLPSIGLVRNTGADAAVAASSVSRALLSIASNQDKFSKLGISVTDASGNFRSFLDIVRETDTALSTQFSSAADRAAEAQDLFGQFGLTAFSAISSQLTKGIQTTTGEVLKGTDAIAFLRREMEQSGGAADEFSERLLSGFTGQSSILRGVIETFVTTIGEPIKDVLTPLISATSDFIKALIVGFKALPSPVQKFLGVMVVASAALATLGGLAVAATAGFVLLAPAIGAIVATLQTVAIIALPLLGVFAALTAGAALFGFAAKENIGGLGDFIQEKFDKIKLAFDGVSQLFSDGFISGDTRDKLLDEKNTGVLSFVSSIAKFKARVEAFIEGVSKSFDSFKEKAAPTFVAIKEVVSDVVDQFVALAERLGLLDAATSGTTSQWERFGVVLGNALVTLVRVGGFIATVFVGGFKILAGAIDFTMQALRFFGNVALGVLKVLVGFLTSDWELAWDGAKQFVFGVLNGITQMILSLVETVAGVSDTIGSIFGIDTDSAAKVRSFRRDLETNLKSGFGIDVNANPSAAEANGNAQANSRLVGTQGISEEVVSRVSERVAEAMAKRPVNMSVEVDGERLMSVSRDVDRDSGARSFSGAQPQGSGF
jgi:TP901 family phage tail tape measure protein